MKGIIYESLLISQVIVTGMRCDAESFWGAKEIILFLRVYSAKINSLVHLGMQQSHYIKIWEI